MGRPIYKEYEIVSRVRATRYDTSDGIVIDGVVSVDGKDIWAEMASSADDARHLAKQEAERIATHMTIYTIKHNQDIEYRNGAEFWLRSW